MSRQIIYKTPQQINNIRESGKYLTELLTLVRDSSREGVTLNQLETIAERFLKTYNLKGAFKGYDGFPTNLCLSVNECVVHGAPDETVLKKGDLLKIDA
ncbi:M24 family metallopeptidase [Patescibacteria group bacterium]|nr:M24 family metallopeptidase [Patescibacteria group bacterium]